MSLSLKSPIGGAVAGAVLSSFFAVNAQAEPPPKGSEQWNMLAPYVDFIKAMRKPDGSSSCCDLADGRGEIQERTVDGKLQVFITRELYPNAGSANVPDLGSAFNLPFGGGFMGGITIIPENALRSLNPGSEPVGIPEEGMWIDVPEADILTDEMAIQACAKFNKFSKDHTCHRPDFNVLWLNISTLQPYCYIRRDMGI